MLSRRQKDILQQLERADDLSVYAPCVKPVPCLKRRCFQN
mgnify:CR=1 FL=1